MENNNEISNIRIHWLSNYELNCPRKTWIVLIVGIHWIFVNIKIGNFMWIIVHWAEHESWLLSNGINNAKVIILKYVQKFIAPKQSKFHDESIPNKIKQLKVLRCKTKQHTLRDLFR